MYTVKKGERFSRKMANLFYSVATVKKAVELLDAPLKNTFLKSSKYNSIVEIVYLDTHVFFFPTLLSNEKVRHQRGTIILYQYRSKAYLFNNEKL